MNTTNLKNTMIVWNPIQPNQIALTPWPSTPESKAETRRFNCSTGACYAEWQNASFEKRKSLLAAELLTIYSGWCISDPQSPIDYTQIHRVLLPLDEYRDLLPLDVIGDPSWTKYEESKRLQAA